MVKGYNKANHLEKLTWLVEKMQNSSINSRPCVFLSHKKEDKPSCRKIAEYLSNAEIDYFLDENDDELQQAVRTGNPTLITERIKEGIRESTHMLVVVSEKTYKSQWVPFEVGYGHSAIIDKGLVKDKREDKIKLSILTLKDIAEAELPTFMQVGNILRGTKSLNEYISKVSGKLEKSMINETRLFSNTMTSHPLDNILNWKL